MEPPRPAVIASPLQFELKPVFGEGREKRWETVQQIFKEEIDRLYGEETHRELLKQLPSDNNLKTRLLLGNERPFGVLIYRTAEADPLNKGLGRCLEVKVFFAKERNSDAYASILKHLREIGEEHQVSTLYAKTFKGSPLINILEQYNFELLSPEKEGSRLLILPLTTKTRKRELEKEEERGLEKKNRPEERRPIVALPPPFHTPLSTPKTLDCPIKKEYFFLIKNGQKTVEGRINNGLFARLVPGEILRFFCGTEQVLCTITAIKKYPSFAKMLELEGVKPCLPNVHSLEAGVKIYDAIPHYAEKAKRFGVLAIHIKRE